MTAERTSGGAGDERVEVVANVLRQHYDQDGDCWCGWVIDVRNPGDFYEQHSAHVAAVLAPLLPARPDDGAAERLAALVSWYDTHGYEWAADDIRAALGQGDGGKGAQEGQGGDLRAEQGASGRRDQHEGRRA